MRLFWRQAAIADERCAQAALIFGVDDPRRNLDIFEEMNFLGKIHHLTSGNLTGLTPFAGDINPKRLELLLAVVPKLSRVAFLWSSLIFLVSGSNLLPKRTPQPAPSKLSCSHGFFHRDCIC